MNEEKMKILQMVEDGKINVDDALKLMDAVRTKTVRIDGEDFDQKVKKFAGNVDSFAREFGGKMEVKFKEMEPTIRKATKVIVEKTACVVNDISRALNESVKNMENKDCGCDNESCEDEHCKDDCCQGDDNTPREN